MSIDKLAVVEQRIECESGKLLFRVTLDGIKVWCEKHKREELYTWGQLQAMREQVLNVLTICA